MHMSCDSHVQAQAKQDFLEAEVEKTKQRENELAIQLGKVKEEVRDNVAMTTALLCVVFH